MFRRGLSRNRGGERKNNEPEYEEVGPPIHLKKTPESRGDGHNCDLCGSMEAAVRCEKCGNQSFCMSCDDMYHRHPRRSSHVRKAVETKTAIGGGVRPPLPPKGEVPPPQPPPRKNKRTGFLSGAGFSKKDQAYARPGTVANRSTSMTNLQSMSGDGSSAGRTIMGSLKRFMGGRPLPPAPDPHKGVVSPSQNEVSNAPPVTNRAIAVHRAATSPSLPNLNDHIEEELRKELPQSVADFTTTAPPLNSVSTPATPTSGHAQYPPLQPKTPQPQSNTHTHSLGRKFSLQQLPQNLEEKRTSMVEPTPGGVGWEQEAVKPPPRTRSHSVSEDQWAQVMAAQPTTGGSTITTEALSGPTCPPGHTPADMSAFSGVAPRRSYAGIPGGRGSGPTLGRGMVSSASVCDLNTLSQQQHQPQAFNGTHGANSFQQLNMMGYGGGMMWGAPCELCQVASAYPGHAGTGGMKRTASNLSMNLSSVSSDITGYPWAAPTPHVHHHMPMYPGYYPGYHPHMVMSPMGAPMGLNVSIPDSMHTFSKVPSSPAPSVRSTSHRSHKSSKSRSFSAPDTSGRRSRNRKGKRSEESEESHSSSVSDDGDYVDDRESKSGHTGGKNIAWQCDHCTFINNGGTRTCGMCSKTVGSNGRASRRGSERRRSERRRDRRTDPEDDDKDMSDYDNQDSQVVKSNLSFSIKDSKRENRSKMSSASKNKGKKKSRRRKSSASDSGSETDGEEEEEERLERHMRDLRLSSRRRGNDYDGVNNKEKDKDRDRASRKKEGSVGRFKNRGRNHSERSRTPGRQTPRHRSPAENRGSYEDDFETSSSDLSHEPYHTSLSGDQDQTLNSIDGTLVDTLASEATLKTDTKSKPNNSADYKHKSKGSKASSPARSIAQEKQDQDPPNVNYDNKKHREKSPSPKVNVRRSKSPPLSRGEVEESSFANTLDDVATMGTNEVADQDLGSQYTDDQPHGVDMIDEPQHLPPVQPSSPAGEEVAEESKTIAFQPPPVALQPAEEILIKEEIKFEAQEKSQMTNTLAAGGEPVYEPSYETVEDPAEKDSPKEEPKKEPEPVGTMDTDQGNYQEAVSKEVLIVDKPEELPPVEVLQVAKVLQSSHLDTRVEMARSASSGSSMGLNSPQDRQYTPLSFSSSDAQFYSPPDSPDISLSEQLQENLQPGQTQGHQKNTPERSASAGPLGTLPADLYESLSFHDALTAPNTDASLLSAASDKATTLPFESLDITSASVDALINEDPRPFKWGEEDVNEKYLTVEEIITKRRQEAMRKQGLKLVQILRDAEDLGYQSEDVSIALTHCGDKNPLEWLKENWRHMVDTVATLATNYGQERQVNDIGLITATEAKTALRFHKGNIWAAVTECVEQRQKKFSEIYARGRFQREDVVRALEKSDGDVDAAFLEVNKSQVQPFLMKIWNPVQATLKRFPSEPSISSPPPSSPPATNADVPLQKENLNIASEHPTPETSQASKGILGGRLTPTFESKMPSKLWHGLCSLFDNSTKRNTTEDQDDEDEDDDQDNEDELDYEEEEEEEEEDDEDDEDDDEEDEDEEEEEEDGNDEDEEKIEEQKEKDREILFIDTSDEDDIFENTYATIDHIRQPPKVEAIYATVKKRPKPTPKVEELPKSTRLEHQKVLTTEGIPSSSSEKDLNQIPAEEEVVTAGEVTGPESEEDESQEAEQEEKAAVLEEEEEKEDIKVEDEEEEEEDGEERSEEEDDINFELKREPPAILQYVRPEAESGDGILEQEELVESEEHEGVDESEQPDRREGSEEGEEKTDFQAPPIEPGMLQTRTGPVTIQKASAIVGKAIAKAMARESSVRESHSGSETPEQLEAPMATPESSEEDEEEEETQESVSDSDSDSDDQLHILDTIPEEEEISEMTESGRVIIRPALKRSPSRGETPPAPTPPSPPSPTPPPAALSPVEPPATPPVPKTPSPEPPKPETSQEPKKEEVRPTTSKTEKSKEVKTTNKSEDVKETNTNQEEVITSNKTDDKREDVTQAKTNKREDSMPTTSKTVKTSEITPSSTNKREEVTPTKTNKIDEVTQAKTDTREDLAPTTSKTEKTKKATPINSNKREEVIPIKTNKIEKVTQAKTDTREDSAPTTSKTEKTKKATPINSNKREEAAPTKTTKWGEVIQTKTNKREESRAATKTSQTPNKPPSKTADSKEVAPVIKKVQTTTKQAEAASAARKNAVDPKKNESDNKPTIKRWRKPTTIDSKKDAPPAPSTSTSKSSSSNTSKAPPLKDNTGAKKSESDENTSVNKQNRPTAEERKEGVPSTSESASKTNTSSAPTKDDTTAKRSESDENTTVRRRRPTTEEGKEENPSAPTTSTSTPSSSNSKQSSSQRRRNKSLPESSGESEGEEGMVKADRIEGLKSRPNKKEPDYQEMRELKEQIQLMKKELESKIEDSDHRPDTPETPQDDQPVKSPYILLPETPQEKPPPKEYEQLKFDRTVRRLLAEGQAGSYEKAELAAHLLNLNFDETDSVVAAEECSSIYTAIQFLQQDCELCAEKYPMRKMVSMLQCIHRCCCECAKTYYTFQIKTKNIREVRCPFCNEPDLDANEEIANEYLNNMDILLKNILDPETHELFQRKLRDWTLMKDPNFRWCNKCSSGFIANPRARKLICPDCKDVTCAQCRSPWESTHEGISCEAFAQWKADNDMEVSVQGVAKHLAECGITCPSCKFTYSLAKGGCMHFTCTQCKYEFCSGCGQPFRQGAKCPVGPYCERLGLHAHHPRNCLFYLRDKEPQQLQNLLKEAGVSYDTEFPKGQEPKEGGRTSCQVQEQKELADGLKDDICGRIVPSGYAGLCRLHYTEYLVEKINAHKLDPVSIFDEADLRVCLRRNGKTVPVRRWESEKLYRDKLIKLIKEHLPLESLN